MGGVLYKPGNKVKTYEIVRELNRGAFANAYEAVSPYHGRVFFKQYKSPSILVEWYAGFVDHQKEIKRRINDDPAARDRCYKFIDFFEERGFYQVFEFIEGGKTLTECIAERDRFSWEQVVKYAKTMMFGMKALHQVKVIHTDLKPDNIILIPDATIGMGYKLRIIDLDWAIFADRQAPWHGKKGYVGTPNYQSPEHLTADLTPLLASDILTCGIMLGELLGDGHPFAAAGDDYNAAVLAGRFKPIRLRQAIPKVDDQGFLEAILNSCLNPDPSKRPTAAQVCDAIMGKTFPWHSVEPIPAPPPPPRVTPPPPPPPPPPRVTPRPSLPPVNSKSVEISFYGKKVTQVTVAAEFGKQLFKSTHADAQFLSNPQFKLRKQAGQWMIEHCATATNETIVDGRKLVGTEPVRDGMRVAVGNSAKGVEKFPLVLKLVS